MAKIKLFGGVNNREVVGTFSSVSAVTKWIKKTRRVEKGFEVFVSPFSELHIECNGAPAGGYFYSIGRKC